MLGSLDGSTRVRSVADMELQLHRELSATMLVYVDSANLDAQAQWCHIGLTRAADGVTVKLFINGAQVGVTTVLGHIAEFGQAAYVTLGGDSSGKNLIGKMQNVDRRRSGGGRCLVRLLKEA